MNKEKKKKTLSERFLSRLLKTPTKRVKQIKRIVAKEWSDTE